MADDVDSMSLGAINRATSTPTLRSLGLDTTCLVAPYRRPAHSGLALIGHETINAQQSEGFVGHEWKADQHLYRGSTPVIVYVVGQLWRVSIGPGKGSTRVVSLRFASPPCLAPPRPTLGSVPQGSSEGGLFHGKRFLPHPTDRWALVAKGLFLAALLTGGP